MASIHFVFHFSRFSVLLPGLKIQAYYSSCYSRYFYKVALNPEFVNTELLLEEIQAWFLGARSVVIIFLSTD